ncbi:TonB-dependent receptor [Acetobacteraceae bacterium ESL0709]|nr:TonB-dependent receptor [Acetobacteraceae bacterium ESL0697]MDF7679005.1 TonB-dependent receptor [Acetobacteraceae bacterium ESL0709]
MKCKSVLQSVLVVGLLSDIYALAASDFPEEITVTADQVPRSINQTGSQVMVITARDMELTQRRDLSTVLAYAPGLNMVRTGGPGGTGSIFMRGLNANEVKLRLDGMDINDPSTPAGAFDPAQFLSDGLARIEVLRGPQSGLYGADAMAGVIDMTTRKGGEDFKVEGRAEGGAYATANQMAAFSGGFRRFHYYVALSHNHVGVYQAVPAHYRLQNMGEIAANRNDNRTATMRFDYEATSNLDFKLTGHLTQADYEFEADQAPPPDYISVPSNLRNESDLNQAIVRGEARLKSFDGVFEQRVGLGYVTYRRRDETAGENEIAFNRGDRLKADWHGLTQIIRNVTLLAGYDYIKERLIRPSSHQTTTHAGYGQLDGHWDDVIYGAANIRYDSNSRYGHYVTWRVAPAIRIPHTGLTLKGSGGAGFHGPSLNQLFVSYPDFNSFSNPHLKAEKLIGFDSGFEEHLLKEHLVFGAAYYENHVHNLINYAYVSSVKGYSYLNVARARTHGLEAYVTAVLCSDVRWQSSYTYTVTRDLDEKEPLLRRPRHKVTSSFIWTPLKRLSIVPSVLYVSAWHDTDRYNFAKMRASGYVTFDLAAQYKLASFTTIFMRADNLADNHYENPSGYWQPRRSFYGGVTIGL